MTARLFPLLFWSHLVGAFLLLMPTPAHAGIITISSLSDGDSILDYGGPFASYAAAYLRFPAADQSPLFATVVIDTGPLIDKSFTAGGTSIYQYAGGDLWMWFFGDLVVGQFEAEVLDTTITVLESDTGDFDLVTAAFRLGAGLFDAPVAAALGVSRHTIGGSLVDPWLYGVDGPTDVERYAEEGTPKATIEAVPEPSLLALLALGVGMSTPIIARCARSRRRT